MASLVRNILAGVLGSRSLLHPRETQFETGSLGSAGAEIITDCDGSGTVSLDLRNSFTATIEVSGTVDGVNWTLIPIRPLNVASKQYVASVSTAGSWVGSCAGFRKVRARVITYSAGAAAAVLTANVGTLDQSLDGLITPLIVTAVGTGGAAVTLTLPSPGAGLRQYLTYLSVNRFATAALSAAAAPVTVTTTNLPGSLALSFAADAALQGTLDRWREDFAYPIPASAQATAVTVVAPAITGVIWRLTAGYYVAP